MSSPTLTGNEREYDHEIAMKAFNESVSTIASKASTITGRLKPYCLEGFNNLSSRVSISQKRWISIGALACLVFSLAVRLSYSQNTMISATVSGDLQSKASTDPGGFEWLKSPEIKFDPDFYSGTWLMSKETFLAPKANLDKLDWVEDACYALFRRRVGKVRMPLDWLEFSVEYMSGYWRALQILPQGGDAYEYEFNRVISILNSFAVERVKAALGKSYSKERSFLRPTIALIAFQQYQVKRDASQARSLTVASLAATMASLIQVGFGRVVVVGYAKDDEELVREAFGVFEQHATLDTELVYARATKDLVVSQHVKVNMPRAALLGLQKAMVGENNDDWTQKWLGKDPSQWKYVYLTEPDALLHTRPTVLRSMEAALNDGLILVPHRLLTIPYQDDFPDSSNEEKEFLPSNFKTPIMLDALVARDVCCDEQAGPLHRPGSHETVGSECGKGVEWWRCGWGTGTGNHTRLEEYGLLRLKQGTGVVNLASTTHARRCIPKKKSRCELKTTRDKRGTI